MRVIRGRGEARLRNHLRLIRQRRLIPNARRLQVDTYTTQDGQTIYTVEYPEVTHRANCECRRRQCVRRYL